MPQNKKQKKTDSKPIKKLTARKPKPGSLQAFEKAMQFMKKHKLDFGYLR